MGSGLGRSVTQRLCWFHSSHMRSPIVTADRGANGLGVRSFIVHVEGDRWPLLGNFLSGRYGVKNTSQNLQFFVSSQHITSGAIQIDRSLQSLDTVRRMFSCARALW